MLGSDDEEQEDPKDYREGGYHPVTIGDVFNGRYLLPACSDICANAILLLYFLVFKSCFIVIM